MVTFDAQKIFLTIGGQYLLTTSMNIAGCCRELLLSAMFLPPHVSHHSLIVAHWRLILVETVIRSDNPYWSLVYGKGLEAADTDVFWTNFL